MNPDDFTLGSASRAYHLSLRDGSRWCFSADRRNTSVLDRLASIMRLRRGSLDGGSRLIFCSKDARQETGFTGSGRAYTPFRFREIVGKEDIFCEAGGDRDPEIQYLHMRYGLFPIFRKSVHKGGLVIHGALVALEGRGALLIGPGGSGKSTCCRRLPRPWHPFCDDEALVVLGKDGKYRVHPFPTWSDYFWKRTQRTWDVRSSAPLSGFFFLEKGPKDAVEPLGPGKTAVLLNASANQVFKTYLEMIPPKDRRALRQRCFQNACKMAHQRPAFRLYVSPDGRFWEKMEPLLNR